MVCTYLQSIKFICNPNRFDKLAIMAATDVISEEERRQAVLDLEQSYNEFTEFLNR